jgi:hypothetical protein
MTRTERRALARAAQEARCPQAALSPMANSLAAIAAQIAREIAGCGDAWSTDAIAEAVQRRLYRVAPEIEGTVLDQAVLALVEIQRERGREHATMQARASAATVG